MGMVERYDLKGILEQRLASDHREGLSENSLLFEKEFLDNTSALRLHSRTRVKLLQQISSDCNFLKVL